MLLVTLAKRDVNLIGIQASNRVIMVEASPYKPVVISM